MRDAFGADGDGAAAFEQGARAVEGLSVARGVRALVLSAIDGDGVERAHERADDGHPKQRLFGEERDAARRVAEDEDRIDERVRVVQDEDARAPARHTLRAAHLYAPEEDAQRESQHGH